MLRQRKLYISNSKYIELIIFTALSPLSASEVQKCNYAETSCIIKATNEILVKHSNGKYISPGIE